jgi:hypothetical protein
MGPMTEDARRQRVPGWTWPILLVGALGIAVLLDGALAPDRLEVANPDRGAADGLATAFEALPEGALVLVAMDPDLGTYPEIRPAVRAALDALRSRGAAIAVVSLTTEGRAIAAAEIARLRSLGASADRLLDLGYVAGAEAGLVLSVTDLAPAEGEAFPASFATARRGIAAFDLALVVGGVDLGPRTWVEQVGTRLPDLPLAAIVPSFRHPEVAPYLRSGQLVALLGTARDGAAYASASAHANGLPSATGLLVGLLIALAVMLRAAWGPRQPVGGATRDAEKAA